MKLNPENDYIHFSTDGRAEVIPGGSAFWSLPPDEMAAFDRGWLVTEHVFTEDWRNWEMHPEGDELVYLLDGEVAMLLERPSGTTVTHLVDRGAVLVPRGLWHTARVLKPSRMLFMTRGASTCHKPVN
ncbi:MAG: hypothetical protein WAQ27_02905 [Candidatus Microsaccharimonas sp.]